MTQSINSPCLCASVANSGDRLGERRGALADADDGADAARGRQFDPAVTDTALRILTEEPELFPEVAESAR